MKWNTQYIEEITHGSATNTQLSSEAKDQNNQTKERMYMKY